MPHPVRFWAGVVLFSSIAGGYGAWFTFYLGYHVARAISRPFRREEAKGTRSNE